MRIPVMVDGELTVYRVWFQHKRNQISSRMKLSQPRHMGMDPHSSTLCYVDRGDEGIFHPVGEGEAVYSLSDQFEKGRKVALARAIEGLPRKVRAGIWAGYLGRAFLSVIDYIECDSVRREVIHHLKETP